MHDFSAIIIFRAISVAYFRENIASFTSNVPFLKNNAATNTSFAIKTRRFSVPARNQAQPFINGERKQRELNGTVDADDISELLYRDRQAEMTVMLSDKSAGSSRTLVGGRWSKDPKLSSVPASLLVTCADVIPHSDGLCSEVYRSSIDSCAEWPYRHKSTRSEASDSFEDDPLTVLIRRYGGLPGWVCVKRVQLEEQPQPHSVEKEISLLDRLAEHEHENVVPLLAAFLDTSDPFGITVDLVMPLYAATLAEVLQEPSLVPHHQRSRHQDEGQLRPGNSISHLWVPEGQNVASLASFTSFVMSVARQLLSALSFLKEEQMAHRDIKPSNLLLSQSGQLKLIDLGTAWSSRPTDELPLTRSQEQNEEIDRARICQVGTGVFRAPELLFSPTNGYDAFAVDVWAAGVTLAHFFTALTSTKTAVSSNRDVDEFYEEKDDRPDWQRALEDDVALDPAPQQQEVSPSFWQEEFESTPPPSSPSGYVRTTLFEAERGDIGLAASIFDVLGLPTSQEDWPEATYFQPPLHRLPFAATKGKGLRSALPLFDSLSSHPDEDPDSCRRLNLFLENTLLPALQLSASKRPSAAELLESIQSAL